MGNDFFTPFKVCTAKSRPVFGSIASFILFLNRQCFPFGISDFPVETIFFSKSLNFFFLFYQGPLFFRGASAQHFFGMQDDISWSWYAKSNSKGCPSPPPPLFVAVGGLSVLLRLLRPPS